MKKLKNYTFYTLEGEYQTTAFNMREALYNLSNHKKTPADRVTGGKIESIN